MGRTLVQWASHATWSAPRHAACIGISQQWRANLTDGNSVTQAQVTSIKKNFINLTVLAGDRNSILVAGALLGQPIRLSYREQTHFWAFQNARCPLLALNGDRVGKLLSAEQTLIMQTPNVR